MRLSVLFIVPLSLGASSEVWDADLQVLRSEFNDITQRISQNQQEMRRPGSELFVSITGGEFVHATPSDAILQEPNLVRFRIHEDPSFEIVYMKANPESARRGSHPGWMISFLNRRAQERGLASSELVAIGPLYQDRPTEVSPRVPFKFTEDELADPEMNCFAVFAILVRPPSPEEILAKIKNGRPMSLPHSFTIGVQIIKALKLLHEEAHIVHGELSPGAISINADGNVKFVFSTESRFLSRENEIPSRAADVREAYRITGWLMQSSSTAVVLPASPQMGHAVEWLHESILTLLDSPEPAYDAIIGKMRDMIVLYQMQTRKRKRSTTDSESHRLATILLSLNVWEPDLEAMKSEQAELFRVFADMSSPLTPELFRTTEGSIVSVRRGRVLARTRFQVDCKVQHRESLRIMYLAHPQRPNSIHPGYLIQALTKRASDFGISGDEIIAIRASVGGSARDVLKAVPFLMTQDDSKSGNAFSVMSLLFRVAPGYTLSAVKQKGDVTFHDAITIGIELIETLKRLHMDARIVHGSLGPNTVVLSPSVAVEFTVRSRFLDQRGVAMTPDGLFDVQPLPQFASIAELQQPGPPTRTGDIYSAYALTVWLCQPVLTGLDFDSKGHWITWKKAFQFTLTDSRFSDQAQSIHNEIASLVSRTGEPDYDTVIGKMNELKDLLDRHPIDIFQRLQLA